MITGRTRVFGLVGHPIRHSLSPAMHNELFRRRGIDAVYLAFDTSPDRAEQVAPAVRALGVSGVNLTVPFKERVLPALDVLSDEAACAGAVNVVIHRDGRLEGFNTDGQGYLRALREELGVLATDGAATILGAGGTARAVGAALAGAGASRVTFLNRTLQRAEAAAEALAPRFAGTSFSAAELHGEAFAALAPETDLVVNCTSGDGATVGALDIGGLRSGSVWTDANYWMADPPQLVACARQGVRIQRGIGMLMHQGALSFEHFTGVPVDIESVRGVLDIGGW
jgi:shikimate dehydrogenase